MPLVEKHAEFVIHATEPLVGGPPLPLLRRHFITPTELFFIRNHGVVPQVDPGHYQLQITGLVRQPLSLTLADLQRLPRSIVIATLQCAGNRRDELMAVQPIPNEVAWCADGLSTAQWTGAHLTDVLQMAGIADGALHTAFVGLDHVTRHGETFGYGGSIPLDKALASEVLLAYAMNGAPLPAVHGYPLRVVVPGYIGARSVKWLSQINLQAEPSGNYFQAKAYRLFAPHVRAETVTWEEGHPLGELSVNAVICSPEPGAMLRAGSVLAQGYAMAGGGRQVVQVEVSPDGGATWTSAQVQGVDRWAWQFWQAQVTLAPGPAELVVRARDSAANTQPEDPRSVWNFKGYMNNAWHRVKVVVRD